MTLAIRRPSLPWLSCVHVCPVKREADAAARRLCLIALFYDTLSLSLLLRVITAGSHLSPPFPLLIISIATISASSALLDHKRTRDFPGVARRCGPPRLLAAAADEGAGRPGSSASPLPPRQRLSLCQPVERVWTACLQLCIECFACR